MQKIKKIKTIEHKQRLIHQKWCFENGYEIYFKPISSNEGVIVIEKDGLKEIGCHKYRVSRLRIKDEKWWEIIFKLYTKIYEENN